MVRGAGSGFRGVVRDEGRLGMGGRKEGTVASPHAAQGHRVVEAVLGEEVVVEEDEPAAGACPPHDVHQRHHHVFPIFPTVHRPRRSPYPPATIDW